MTRQRLALAVVALVVAAVIGVCAGFRPLVKWAMTPRVAFAEQAPPVAPDYADDAAWSALPDRADAGDAVPAGMVGVDQEAASADVFYVHPTSYVGSRWNGPVDDPRLNADTDRVATGIQATAFNGCCAVYAPRYRQANGSAFFAPTPDGDAALDLAYGDVRRAFDEFLARRGTERPFILAGHSQGSVLAERLLYEIVGTPLADRLVYAVLPGGGITADGLREHGVRLCATPTDLGCVVAWNARSPSYRPGAILLIRPDQRELACTNPLSWRDDGLPVAASENRGAVFLETDDTAPKPAFADAQCVGGLLVVSDLGNAPRDVPSRILDRALGVGNYHPIEYQIFFVDLRANANDRVAAWLARGG